MFFHLADRVPMLIVIAFISAQVLVLFRLHLELLPLRLHLDQTHLNFLISFFVKDSFDDTSPVPPNNLDDSDMSKTSSRRFGSQTIVEEALLPFFQASSSDSFSLT